MKSSAVSTSLGRRAVQKKARSLVACTPSNNVSAPDADYFVNEGDLFGLRVGDTVGVVTETAVPLLRFNLVTSDSRCPADVECVAAGFATVVVTVQTALDVHERELQMPPEGEVTIEVEEMTFTFTELRPPAADGIAIDRATSVRLERER